MAQLLPSETHIGAVHLTVRDLDGQIAYYEKSLGLATHKREGDTAVLGPPASPEGRNTRTPLLVMHHNPEAKTVVGTTGLYHFAVLVPSRLELAKVVRNFAETETPLDGFADHLVSEAIYLHDPENNGIEIYRDRPRSEWRFVDGHLAMTTDPIDLTGIMDELEQSGLPDQPWAGMHPDTVMGHIHLRVADIPEANKFYVEQVGFDLMQMMGPSASFISAGGYHHHIGMNTWESRGAMPLPADATGLRYYEIHLPGEQALNAVADRVLKSGKWIEEHAEGLMIRDPFNIGVMLKA